MMLEYQEVMHAFEIFFTICFMVIKHTLIRFLFVILIVFYSAHFFSAAAQSPEKILKNAVKALGGEENLRNVSTKQFKGSITRVRDSKSGSFLLLISQPNLFAENFDIDGFENAAGFNGKSGWRRDSQNGLRTLTGEAGKVFQAEALYRNNLWLNYKKEKSKITAGGQAVINGKTAVGVFISTAKNVLIKIYFDPVSNLPLREEFPQISLINDFSDYRIIEGVQEPFQINSSIDNEKYEIKIDSVTHNAQIAKTVFDFPNFSNQSLPDIPELLKQIQANQDKIDNILENYTYTQTNISRELDKNGVLRNKESETFQVTFYKGYRISRQIAKNDKPLSADDQAKEDKEAQKRVAEIDKEIAKKQTKKVLQNSDGTPSENSQRPSIAEVLRASNLTNPRREKFRGRDVIVFDFEPNPKFDYKNSKGFLKFFGKTAGVIWVDVEDKQVARLEAFLADNYKVGGGLVANLQKGASFTLENERINDEIWLPSSADINLAVKVFLIKGFNFNQLIKYSDYQKFNSEVKDSRVDEIKNNN